MTHLATKEWVDATIREIATPPRPSARVRIENGSINLFDRTRKDYFPIEADGGTVVTAEETA